MSLNILVIPDSHSFPGISNRRFEWLGNCIVDWQPDIVVDIGDAADMLSCSPYFNGTPEERYKFFKEELACSRDAQAKILRPVQKYNKLRTMFRKKKKYNPILIKTLGNHEVERKHKYSKHLLPSMQEELTLENLGYSKWKNIPFLQPYIISSVAFCHYFYDKDQRYAINDCSRLLSTKHFSCVKGHDHQKGYAIDTKADGTKIQAVGVGCYLDPEKTHGEYAGYQGLESWDNGLVKLHNVNAKGEFDVEFMSIERVQKTYG